MKHQTWPISKSPNRLQERADVTSGPEGQLPTSGTASEAAPGVSSLAFGKGEAGSERGLVPGPLVGTRFAFGSPLATSFNYWNLANQEAKEVKQ